jgi:hypothetical protein
MRQVWICEREDSSGEFHVRQHDPHAPGEQPEPPRTVPEMIEHLHKTYGPTRKVKRKEEPSE